MTAPQYQERVKKRVLTQTQPELKTYEAADNRDNELESIESSLSRWLWVLGVTVLALISFSVVEAYLSMVELLQTHPVIGIFLAIVLLIFMIALGYLIVKEWSGLRQLKRLSSSEFTLSEYKDKDDREATLKAIKQRVSFIANTTPSYALHQSFFNTIKPHHTNYEVLQIYDDKVQKSLLQKAKKVLKKESTGAGAVAFISPNSLLQTIGILWVSLRTLKKIAFVYGVRPSAIGNLRLFRIALENLAASSVVDFITDELANQVGGSLSDKVLANSTDAITAASLNQRLGKALIKQLTL